MSSEHRPTDEQLRDWADPDGTGFPAYWESEHYDYLNAMFTELLQLRRLLAVFTDHEGCRFDHHGNCQAHDMVLEPGEICPQAEAKQLLAQTEETTR